MKKRKIAIRIVWAVALLLVLMNAVAAFHAYRFTHFKDRNKERTKKIGQLSKIEKLQTVLLGVSLPKPTNWEQPTQTYQTLVLHSNKDIECWHIKTDSVAKGTFILFHGYGGEKSSMLGKSDELLKMGYNTMLVDFMGCGNSEGYQTTIGYKEAEEVKTCFDYIAATGEKKIYLLGTSMGAAAILKALHDYPMQPAGAIVESSFGSMYTTTAVRFHLMKLPTFPMAGLLVFWGSVENTFWAFGHKPAEFAKSVKCPVLVLYGARDEKVTRQETDDIYANLQGPKQLKVYPNAGHENFLNKYREEWLTDVGTFLAATQK